MGERWSEGYADGRLQRRVRAVAYVRMSTDLQEFSPENQLAAIMPYVERRGFEVARIYEDAGKSGLRADNRPGHQRLMAEIESGAPTSSFIIDEREAMPSSSIFADRFGSLLRAY